MAVHELAVYNLTSQELESLDTGDIARFLGSLQLDSGTANGVAFLNAGKVLTTGSGLQFDGTSVGGLSTGGAMADWRVGSTISSGMSARMALGNNAGAARATISLSGNSSELMTIGSEGNFPVAFQIGGTEIARLTSAGLGIGGTPAAWNSAYKALQLGADGFIYGRSDSTQEVAFGANCYRDSGATWRYMRDGYATKLETGGGVVAFYTAASGTAGDGITWTERVRVDADGLKFNGDIAVASALDDYEEGAWTPADNSGAGLSITNERQARYTKFGNQVIATCAITYPATANGASAGIQGLPFTSFAGGVGTIQGVFGATNDTATKSVYGPGSATHFNFDDGLGFIRTNAQLSGKTFYITITYIV